MEPNSLTAELKTQLEVRTRELAETRKALTEALEQQAATSEVLRVISSLSGELQPVFKTILANATHICEATFGALYLCEREGFRAVAIAARPQSSGLSRALNSSAATVGILLRPRPGRAGRHRQAG
jgi:hypothetical protein